MVFHNEKYDSEIFSRKLHFPDFSLYHQNNQENIDIDIMNYEFFLSFSGLKSQCTNSEKFREK